MKKEELLKNWNLQRGVEEDEEKDRRCETK
jgi:hypothetical protein